MSDVIMLTIRKYRKRTTEEMQEEMESRKYQRGEIGFTYDNREANISKEQLTDMLDVCITEEQFEAIRKSVLEKF